MDKIEKQDDAVLLAHALAYHMQKQGNRLAADIIRAAIPAIPGLTAEALEARMDSPPQPPAEATGWYCAHCQRGVDSSEVTYSDQHQACGRYIANDDPPPAEAQAHGGGEVICTCPSGDGSLRWPCQQHPPSPSASVAVDAGVFSPMNADLLAGTHIADAGNMVEALRADLDDYMQTANAEESARIEDAERYRWMRSMAKEQLLNPKDAGSECPDMRTYWRIPTLICSGPLGGFIDFDDAVDQARGKVGE